MSDRRTNGPEDPAETGGFLTAASAGGAGIPPGGVERRRHPRFEVVGASLVLHPAGLRSFLLGSESVGHSVLNLSFGGARLVTLDRLSPQSRVRLRIQLEKFQDVLQAVGRVRWSFESAREEEKFFAGVEFEGLDAARQRLVEAMKSWFTSPQHKLRETTRRLARP